MPSIRLINVSPKYHLIIPDRLVCVEFTYRLDYPFTVDQCAFSALMTGIFMTPVENVTTINIGIRRYDDPYFEVIDEDETSHSICDKSIVSKIIGLLKREYGFDPDLTVDWEGEEN